MVDLADRRRASSGSVDWIPAGRVRTPCLAIVGLGTGAGHKHNLVINPDFMVLGSSDHEVVYLALGIGDYLADIMGEVLEKTGSCLMAGRYQRSNPLESE